MRLKTAEPKQSKPKVTTTKQPKPTTSASKGTFGSKIRGIQKRAKPKAGKITSF
nr:hypothetical protein HUO10_003341 [Paraburkholderia busanensis]